MSCTMEDFRREYAHVYEQERLLLAQEYAKLMPPEELITLMSPEEILKLLPPEEILKHLPVDEIEKYVRRRRKTAGSARKKSAGTRKDPGKPKH
jgi:hypothetical protein